MSGPFVSTRCQGLCRPSVTGSHHKKGAKEGGGLVARPGARSLSDSLERQIAAIHSQEVERWSRKRPVTSELIAKAAASSNECMKGILLVSRKLSDVAEALQPYGTPRLRLRLPSFHDIAEAEVTLPTSPSMSTTPRLPVKEIYRLEKGSKEIVGGSTTSPGPSPKSKSISRSKSSQATSPLIELVTTSPISSRMCDVDCTSLGYPSIGPAESEPSFGRISEIRRPNSSQIVSAPAFGGRSPANNPVEVHSASSVEDVSIKQKLAKRTPTQGPPILSGLGVVAPNAANGPCNVGGGTSTSADRSRRPRPIFERSVPRSLSMYTVAETKLPSELANEPYPHRLATAAILSFQNRSLSHGGCLYYFGLGYWKKLLVCPEPTPIPTQGTAKDTSSIEYAVLQVCLDQRSIMSASRFPHPQSCIWPLCRKTSNGCLDCEPFVYFDDKGRAFIASSDTPLQLQALLGPFVGRPANVRASKRLQGSATALDCEVLSQSVFASRRSRPPQLSQGSIKHEHKRFSRRPFRQQSEMSQTSLRHVEASLDEIGLEGFQWACRVKADWSVPRYNAPGLWSRIRRFWGRTSARMFADEVSDTGEILSRGEGRGVEQGSGWCWPLHNELQSLNL